MTSEEEVLLEQYYSYKNMDIKTRDFCINLILNSKELTDSEYNYSLSSSSKYDLVFITLSNENGLIKFDGAISNGIENKIIYGSIAKKRNKYYVDNNVYRMFELVIPGDRDYRVTDEFKIKDGVVVRKSLYDDGRYFETNIELNSDEEMELFYRNKIGKVMKR